MARGYLSLSKDGEQIDYKFFSDIYCYKEHGSDNVRIKIDLDGAHVGSLQLILGQRELDELRGDINNIGGTDGEN